MRRSQSLAKRARRLAPLVGCAMLSCVSPPLETPPNTVVMQTPVFVEQTLKNKVDLLFMVDNSNSMSAMSNELKNRFNEFFKVFADPNAPTKADLNLGVVTSDYGAGHLNDFGCTPSPGGQRGRLQSVGAYAASTCKAPMGGNNFAHYNFGNTADNNLPAGQDLLATFTCMASVVTEQQSGCGFEHQLESVYAALHDGIPENAGFLRDGALLAVVFLTNEDDASAPPDTDVFDKDKQSTGTGVPGCENGGLGCYGFEDSYSRQTRFAIQCNGAFPPYGDSGGALQNCVSAPNPGGAGPGKQYDISRYIDFFTKAKSEGGVKADPHDVILVGIDAPESPFQVILSNPGTAPGVAYTPCSPLNEQASPPCVPVLQHSCVGTNPQFFGDPSVRLNTVIRSASHNNITSICANDYTQALQDLANLIKASFGNGCITSALPKDANGNPVIDCVVEDITVSDTDGSTMVAELPQCDSTNPVYPCWSADMKSACAPGQSGGSPDGLGITINRNGQPPPDNTNTRVACATIPPM